MSLNVSKDWEKDNNKNSTVRKKGALFSGRCMNTQHSLSVNVTRCKVLVERLLKVSLNLFWNTWNVWRISMRVLGVGINWNGGCFLYSSRKLFFQIFYLDFILFSHHCTKMKFPVKDFFGKCDQIRTFLGFWSHLLKKSLIENFIFCVVRCFVKSLTINKNNYLIIISLRWTSI